MNDQTLIDALADELVEKGKLVSYSSLQAALQKHNSRPGEDDGKGASYRDLKTLLNNWRDRRRYKGHLAALRMPEKMEKALAVFAARAMRAADDLAAAKLEAAPATPDALAVMAQMERLVGRFEEQMAGLAAENRSLREEIAAMRPAPAVIAEAVVPGDLAPCPALVLKLGSVDEETDDEEEPVQRRADHRHPERAASRAAGG